MNSFVQHIAAGATLRGCGPATSGLALCVHADQLPGVPLLRGDFTLVSHAGDVLAAHLGDVVSHNAFVDVQRAMPQPGARGNFEEVHAALLAAVGLERIDVVNRNLLGRTRWELVGPDEDSRPPCGRRRAGDLTVNVDDLNSEEGFLPFASILCCATALADVYSADKTASEPEWTVGELLLNHDDPLYASASPTLGGLATVTSSHKPSGLATVTTAKVVLDLAMQWATPAIDHNGGLLFQRVSYCLREDFVVVRVPNAEAYETYFLAKYRGVGLATPTQVYALAAGAVTVDAGTWVPARFALDKPQYKYEQRCDLVKAHVVARTLGNGLVQASSLVQVTIDKKGATVKEEVEITIWRSLSVPPPPPTITFHNGAGYFAVVHEGKVVSLSFVT